MKEKTLPSIHVILKPSYVILGYYFFISTLCCVSILIVMIPSIVKVLSLVIITLSFIYIVLRDVLLLLPWSWQSVTVTSLGQLRLVNQKNQVFDIDLLPSTFNHPFLTVLNFKRMPFEMGWCSATLITPWQVYDMQAYRRLRVWLKWWPHQDRSDVFTE
jgi:hypothetical protein